MSENDTPAEERTNTPSTNSCDRSPTSNGDAPARTIEALNSTHHPANRKENARRTRYQNFNSSTYL
jgi:hypothetical protein